MVAGVPPQRRKGAEENAEPWPWCAWRNGVGNLVPSFHRRARTKTSSSFMEAETCVAPPLHRRDAKALSKTQRTAKRQRTASRIRAAWVVFPKRREQRAQ